MYVMLLVALSLVVKFLHWKIYTLINLTTNGTKQFLIAHYDNPKSGNFIPMPTYALVK